MNVKPSAVVNVVPVLAVAADTYFDMCCVSAELRSYTSDHSFMLSVYHNVLGAVLSGRAPTPICAKHGFPDI